MLCFLKLKRISSIWYSLEFLATFCLSVMWNLDFVPFRVTTCSLKKVLNQLHEPKKCRLWGARAGCCSRPVLTGPLFAAYCKNSVDGLWYCFDDSDVQQLSEDEVCTQTAYILFYQRRTAIPSWSANSSVAGEAALCGSSFQCGQV